jgi:hypothetical protein
LSGASFRVEEATIAGIQSAMLAGELRCRALVEAYLRRIDAFDRNGPKLNAIVSVCDQALDRARELDEELAATGRPSRPSVMADEGTSAHSAAIQFSSATADATHSVREERIGALRNAFGVGLAQ